MPRGAIDRRNNGRYRARHEGADRRWHSRTFDRKADAERWLTDQLSKVNRGQWIDPSAVIPVIVESDPLLVLTYGLLRSRRDEG